MKKNILNYKRIYTEMIKEKFPEKEAECDPILRKKEISVMDVINLNKLIGSESTHHANQRRKSYDRSTIFQILDYQKKHRLNNLETARHFSISRNTLGFWKKRFST